MLAVEFLSVLIPLYGGRRSRRQDPQHAGSLRCRLGETIRCVGSKQMCFTPKTVDCIFSGRGFAMVGIAYDPQDLQSSEATELSDLLQQGNLLEVSGKHAVQIYRGPTMIGDLAGEDVCMCVFY